VAIEAPEEALAKNERGGGRRRSRKNNANKRNTIEENILGMQSRDLYYWQLRI
jgi:hypothetical protein